MAVGPVRESCPLGVGRFAELRVPNPPDFLAFIADDLAERRQEIAALHTLQKRLDTIARSDSQQIPADSFVSLGRGTAPHARGRGETRLPRTAGRPQ
jgi:hypothetical protein